MVLIDGQAGMPAAGSGRSAAAVEAAGAAASVYGLTVSGPGLVPLVDPAFQGATDRRPVELVVEAPGSIPRAKVTATGILGDADNNGQVDLSDALLVALYSQDASIILPNPGAISLGDVNADDQVDLADAGLLGAYLNDPSDPALPAGLGKRVSSATASLSPDPSTVSFADDGIWHRFTVEAGEPIAVVVNPGATTPRLEITSRSGRDNYCPGKADDAVSREDDEAVYLAGCASGTATVELRRESDDTVVQTYTFTVAASPADLVVESTSVSASTLEPRQSFTLSVTVRNQGTAESAATTLRYYGSSNKTISWQDTQVGSDEISSLAASATSDESISLTAPSKVGKYYYGACVERQSGERASNNCSKSKAVTVRDETSDEEGGDSGQLSIPDANLRAAITAALGKASGATITVEEMSTLGVLVAEDAGIRDLTGLEFATNLTWLGLHNNNISDISPLSGLTNLTGLGLHNNNISDISPLSGLTNLTGLGLHNNNISDISPLSGLTNLRILGLMYNNITNISALSGLTNLTSLYLDGNNITDISALLGLTNLTQLWLEQNPLNAFSINDHIPAFQARGVEVTFDPTPSTIEISDDPTPVTIRDTNLRAAIAAALGKTKGATITKGDMTTLLTLEASDAGIRNVTGLEFATNLTKLVLDGNTVWSGSALKGLTALSGLTNLTELDLSGNNLTDLSALSGLTNLKRLHLYFNNLKNVSPLRGLTNLEHLNLDNNNLKNVSALSGLTNLEHLNLDNNNLTSLSAFSDLTNLRVLYLGGNNLKNSALSDLTNLTNLTNLGLGHNNLTSLSALRGLTNLYWLWLSGNNLKDVSKLASVLSGFDRLEWLALGGNNIRDISKLTPAVPGLTHLWLDGNDIKDISSLRRLPHLEWLWIAENNITDISALSSLTKLQGGGFRFNNISDLSPLAGLPNLTDRLHFEFNNITDVSPLAGLTDLKGLYLGGNNITDVSPLAGLTSLEKLDLEDNPLSAASINRHIPRLQDRGVTVWFKPTPFREGDFDIEFVFLDPFTDSQKNVFRLIARKWTSVIVDDLPDYEFAQGWSGECGDESFRIPTGERIDDLRIYVTSFDGGGNTFGWGSPSLLRETTHLPVLGCMAFDLKRANLFITGLHEIGHVLGFGPVWRDSRPPSRPTGDPHFNGPRAIAAFNDAGGQSYTGKKVPVQEDEVHWRGSLLNGDLMVPWGGGSLSAITVESLADLGYGVDVTQADPFILPDAASAKVSAKIAAAAAVPFLADVDVTPADAITLSGVQGRGAAALPSIPIRPLQGRLESDERIGSRGFDLRNNLLMGVEHRNLMRSRSCRAAPTNSRSRFTWLTSRGASSAP